MLIADVLTITASCLLVANEIKNFSKNKIIEKFIVESHIINDRLDAIEKTLIKLLNR